MRLRISLRDCVRPSVRRSVGRSLFIFEQRKFLCVTCESKKSSNDIINHDTMSDDEVVASFVPPRYLFLYIFVLIGFCSPIIWQIVIYTCLPLNWIFLSLIFFFCPAFILVTLRNVVTYQIHWGFRLWHGLAVICFFGFFFSFCFILFLYFSHWTLNSLTSCDAW